MKFVIQRVLNAQTTIIETDSSGEKKEYVSGRIGKGYMVLCGIMETVCGAIRGLGSAVLPMIVSMMPQMK